MRIWRWTIMRTADVEAMLDVPLRMANDSLRQKDDLMHSLCNDLERCKEGLRGAIEQREKLAAKLREAKR